MSKERVIVGPASKKQEIFLNSDATITLAGGSAGCFDKDTEFLSSSGWKKFEDYSVGDLVGQYDPSTDTVSLVKPLDFIKEPCDSFSRMQARGLDFCLTDEHKVPFWSATNLHPHAIKSLPFSLVKEKHLATKRKGWQGKIKTTFRVDKPGINLSEGEIRLQVAAQADGRYVKEGKDNYCQMRFAKVRKYLRLLEICKKFNLRHKDNGAKPSERYKSGFEYEVIVWPENATKLYTDWWDCSQEQLEIIADEVKYWDASTVSNDSDQTVRYFTKHRENADFMQYVFHATGYNTSLVIDKRDGSFTVNANKTGKGFRSFVGKETKCSIEEYKSLDGFKYCFEVPSSFLVVRRSGKVFISGNSGKTYTSLLIALKFMQHPKATGIIFRRTRPELTSPGSIWHEAVAMYSSIYKTGLRIRHRDLEIIFPNGALLKFSHMQHESNMYDHKG